MGTERRGAGGRGAVADATTERRQAAGVAAIEAALDAGEPVRRLLVAREPADPAVAALARRARDRGIPVESAGPGDLRRLAWSTPTPEVLALVGGDPDAPDEALLAGPGARWLLVGAAYPGNVGAALRTVEVSGATAAFVDAPLDRTGRRAALRTSMNADRFLPVRWEAADAVLDRARTAGLAIVGVEDVGDRAPWQVDLVRPSLFVVGGEDRSLSPAHLSRCDVVVRLPMRGFVPCYNLQAAVAAVAIERLRQLEAAGG
jgi:23S rRNA (guanosine2251-2'-O)-methyltransferase